MEFNVDGGTLHAVKFGDGPNVIIAAHGITASGMSYSRVARHLPPGWTLIGLDLRGRGHSNELPGPFGMDQHAADICAAASQLGGPVVLTGQSMGAYAALRAAATRPELFSRLVMIDGGLPLPIPEGIDPEVLLLHTVGPAIARLSETYPSEEDYVAFFRAHPALAEEWNDDMTAYALYDAVGSPVRSRVNAAAVSADGLDLIVNAASFGADLAALRIPAELLYAPKGMLGQEPGLLPEPLVQYWDEQIPGLRTELIAQSNHYTILMTDGPASIIAARLCADHA